MNYLGKHTAISYLQPEHFGDIPFLRQNGGRLPPFVIAVGDGRRAERACGVLELQDIVSLAQAGERHAGLKGRGRVAMYLGLFQKRLPLVIVETQMGMPAVEIILKEVLSHCATRYSFGGRTTQADAIYLIRAGTAGALKARAGLQIKCGEITNTTFSLGWSGAAVQSMAGLRFDDPETLNNFRKNWLALGLQFTTDGCYPLAASHEAVSGAIQSAASNLGIPCHLGANFSKDSLYAETNEEVFVTLHEKYGVISTEMEQIAVAKVAAELRSAGTEVRCGMVAGILGILPGFSDDQHLHEVAERRALQTAAEALWLLSGCGNAGTDSAAERPGNAD